MTASSSHSVTQLLLSWRKGDAAALDQLVPVVYQKLRRLARHHMAGQRPGHTLQATALVNEAYMRLIDCEQVNWKDRAHFFAICARTPVSETGSGSEKDIARRRCDCLSTTRTGSRRTRRCSTGPCSGISPAGASRGTAVFRGIERGRNRRGTARVGHHGHARLAIGQGLVGSRTEKARFQCPRNDRNKLSSSPGR